MGKSSVTKAFITLNKEHGVIGSEITKTIVFHGPELREKVKKLNGQATSYVVAEVEIEKGEFKEHGNQLILTDGSTAVIKNCFSVNDFILM